MIRDIIVSFRTGYVLVFHLYRLIGIYIRYNIYVAIRKEERKEDGFTAVRCGHSAGSVSSFSSPRIGASTSHSIEKVDVSWTRSRAGNARLLLPNSLVPVDVFDPP